MFIVSINTRIDKRFKIIFLKFEIFNNCDTGVLRKREKSGAENFCFRNITIELEGKQKGLMVL